jgi:proteic killer suppression protein
VIQSYRDKRTGDFAAGSDVAAFRSFADQARKRLRILDASTSLRDLGALRGNRLEAMKGQRKGQWSIRINAKWRICFVWNKGDKGPHEVEIVDYHDE